MPDRPPAVVVFDVNQTLSNFDGLVPRFQEVNADPGVVPIWFAATLRDGFALTAAGGYADFSDIAIATLTALLSGNARLLGSPDEAAQHIIESMAELDVHPDVATGLRTFHAAGVRIVTLSNGSSRVAESLLERAGLRGLVERCLSVSEARRWKPAREAYRLAADRCHVEVGELALIAVHPWDVDGAIRAGLRGGWLSRDGAAYPPFLHPPDATGQNLPELAATLCGSS
jgi:2-haloacid dehalogenase